MFIFSLIIFLHNEKLKKLPHLIIEGINKNLKYLVIIFIIVIIHLIEVNILDSYFTNLVGIDFAAALQSIEDNIVFLISQQWILPLVYFFTTIYIVVYPFTLWFSPFYFVVTGNQKAMKSLSYGLMIIYALALPFYLFLPISNVYTYYGLGSPLEATLSNVEEFFYATTTHNNCLPSLHVAMTVLIAYTITHTKNKRLILCNYICSLLVIISVIYLAIHWLTDVVCGLFLAFLTIYILKNYVLED